MKHKRLKGQEEEMAIGGGRGSSYRNSHHPPVVTESSRVMGSAPSQVKWEIHTGQGGADH